MYRGALQAIFSELVRKDALVVVDGLAMDAPSTQGLVGKLKELDVEQGLLITADVEENLYLSSRNIPGLYVVDVAGIDPVSLVSADKVVVTVDAIAKIQEWLG